MSEEINENQDPKVEASIASEQPTSKPENAPELESSNTANDPQDQNVAPEPTAQDSTASTTDAKPEMEMPTAATSSTEETQSTTRSLRLDQPTHHINENPPIEGFDWDDLMSSSVKSKVKTKERIAREELLASTLQDIKVNEVIEATIVAITDKDVVVNIGSKSDGLVPLSEFKYNAELKIGDTVEVIVETLEDRTGQIIISHKRALAEGAWDKIIAAYENQTIVNGYIKDRTKGGMIVDLMGMDAFLPGSQLDVKPIKDYDIYVGTRMDLKVVKINEQFRNIVVSHKAIIESDLEAQKVEILGKLEKGQILEGVVKNLTNFGVFVDLGGVDGLIHITDVSWGRISHPEEVLEVGQQINVVVLDYDEEKKRISLGMKQLTAHPWDSLADTISEGSKITGKVVNLEDYGAFLEIAPGVEGLVHVSEMSWSTHLKSPQEYVTLGQEIEAVVLSIDREERKLSLGLKQLSIDPWSNIEEKYILGTKHKSIVRSLTTFGLFVELEEGIDGLVHISDLSWTRKFNHPSEFSKVGDELEVVVLGLEKEARRLSLGHKQLEEDPWDTFESIFSYGSLHEGVLSHVDDKGATVTLPYGVEAYAPKKFLVKADKSKAKQEENLPFKVIEFDKLSRRILLSHTDVWKDEERAKNDATDSEQRQATDKTRKEVKKVNKQAEKTSTLADEFDILQQLKSQMEEQDKAKAIAKMEAKSAGTTEAEAAPATEEAPEAPVAEATAEEAPEVTAEETPATEATAEAATEESPAEEAPAAEESEEEKA